MWDDHDGVVGDVVGEDLAAVLEGHVHGGHGGHGTTRHLAHWRHTHTYGGKMRPKSAKT